MAKQKGGGPKNTAKMMTSAGSAGMAASQRPKQAPKGHKMPMAKLPKKRG